jgi:hypothetical protein
LKPNETDFNRFQTVSESVSAIGFKLPPIGELTVLRHLADREAPFGTPIPVRRREVAAATAQTLAGVKTALIRLSKACLIELVEFKCGKVNGFTSYQLTAQARAVLASKEATSSIGFKRFQTVSEPVSIGCSSSSSFLDSENFKTTTSESKPFEKGPVQLSPEWVDLDWQPLTSIGFTQNHLIQIVRQGKLTPSEVQNSIHFFAFDLKRNAKGRELNGSPLNFFMGILRKGVPYAPPENYESPADEARRRSREVLERKERERQADEQRIRDLEFAEWRRGVAAEELSKILPDYARKPGPIQDSAIRAHFDEKVWPEREAARLSVSEAERMEIRTAVAQSLGEVRG